MSARILLVDDNLDVLRALARGLKMEGYTVTTAGLPSEALNLFKQGERFDVVVSDLEMPWLDGDELCVEVQKIASTPFIICSGHMTVHARARACGAGASFVKPVMPSDLAAAIDKLIPKPTTA